MRPLLRVLRLLPLLLLLHATLLYGLFECFDPGLLKRGIVLSRRRFARRCRRGTWQGGAGHAGYLLHVHAIARWRRRVARRLWGLPWDRRDTRPCGLFRQRFGRGDFQRQFAALT